MPEGLGKESIGEVRVDVRADTSKLAGDLAKAKQIVEADTPTAIAGGSGNTGAVAAAAATAAAVVPPEVPARVMSSWERLNHRVKVATDGVKQMRQVMARIALPLAVVLGIERVVNGFRQAAREAKDFAESLKEVQHQLEIVLQRQILANSAMTEQTRTLGELSIQRAEMLRDNDEALAKQIKAIEESPIRNLWTNIYDLLTPGNTSDKLIEAHKKQADAIIDNYRRQFEQARKHIEAQVEELQDSLREATIRENASFGVARNGADINTVAQLLRIRNRQRGGR